MPRKARLTPEAELELWLAFKEIAWARAGRLRSDGTLKVDPNFPCARPDLSPAQMRSMLMVLRKVDVRRQKKEALRMRGRKVKTWRRRFDRSDPEE